MKIVITDYYYANLDAEYRVFKALGEDVEIVDCTKIKPGGLKEPAEIIPYVQDADALIVQFAKIDASVIARMEKCKVITRYAIGFDTIDVAAATEKGIWVSNVPDYCTAEVADTAVAHIMNAVRKISFSRDRLLDGSFTMESVKPIRRMEEQTLCLLGFGRIAREVYRKMQPFFKDVVAYDPYFNDQAAYPDVRFTDLLDAVAQADVISVHVPLNEGTKGLLAQAAFNAMRDEVVIVNTARGPIIDEAALLDALHCGKIGMCGLDVIATEDFAASPLLQESRVVLTPHVGWYSEEAGAELQRKVAENTVKALQTGEPIYKVNSI